MRCAVSPGHSYISPVAEIVAQFIKIMTQNSNIEFIVAKDNLGMSSTIVHMLNSLMFYASHFYVITVSKSKLKKFLKQ